MEDWISRLPDEFLIHILSILTMKEAAKTSVLSTRWRYLWTHTPCLNFERMDIVKNIRLENEGMSLPMVERSKYITWVNTICSSIQAPSIKQFRIHFDLDETAKDNLDKWVEFAIEKKVKHLELILEILPWKSKRYIISCPTTVSSGFKHLQSLDLKFVNISGETLEHFLLHCPSLEQVSIQHSKHLRTLKVGVGGRLLNLKILKIFYCSNLIDLQICAPKLSNFQYQGRAINLQIKNVPSLCHVYIIGKYGDCLTWVFSALSNHLCQLQTLTLLIKQIKGNTNFPQLWQLSSLRELTVRVAGCDYENLLYILSLLNASPFLEKFRIESALEQSGKLLEEKVVELCPLQYLKVLEMIGFDGHPNEVEFVRQLSVAAIRLEKLVIDPIPPWEVLEPAYGSMLFPRKFSELLKLNFSQ